MKISVIVAMAINRAIGFENHLLWHIPEDLRHFKALTLGHAVIMGRKTFESLPCGALPQRRNIVISATKRYLDGCEVYPSVEKAIEACEDEPEVFVIGGESVYRQFLPMADRIYLTLVECRPNKADSFFPEIDMAKWQEIKKEKHDGFSFIEYEAI